MKIIRTSMYIILSCLLLTACSSGHDVKDSNMPTKESTTSTADIGDENSLSGEIIYCYVMDSPSEVTVVGVNKETGVETWSNSFNYHHSESDKVYWGDSIDNQNTPPIFKRLIFSRDYSKITITIPSEDGGRHVGYKDAGGNIVDISKDIEVATGGFSDSTIYHDSPVFGYDNYFYFREYSSNPEKENEYVVKRVPLDNISPESVEIIDTGVSAADSLENSDSSKEYKTFVVLSNNKVLDTGSRGKIENNESTAWAEYIPNSQRNNDGSTVFCDWIDGNRFLALADNNLFIYEAYPMSPSPEIGSSDSIGKELNSILPENDRTNSTGVVSPNGDEVAFISRKGKMSELFTVSVNNGEPKTISLISDDTKNSNAYAFAVLDWQ